jgi:uncharacterized protein YfaS (alpha-2-macroglobulin family)
LDGSGRASISLNIPDFNGRLRLMAVAWSDSALGHDEAAVIVRDPVVAELTLPRFLAPGDEALATLTVDNVEGPAGAYSVSFAGGGAAALAAPAQRLQLARNQRVMTRVPISAAGAGLGRVTLTLAGPNGFTPITRTYDIQSRTSFLPVTLVDTQPQAPAQAYRASPDILAAFAPREGSAVISYSNLAGLDPAPLLAQIERYPYGCTEQLVSTAMPLLYFNALAEVANRTRIRVCAAACSTR